MVCVNECIGTTYGIYHMNVCPTQHGKQASIPTVEPILFNTVGAHTATHTSHTHIVFLFRIVEETNPATRVEQRNRHLVGQD